MIGCFFYFPACLNSKGFFFFSLLFFFLIYKFIVTTKFLLSPSLSSLRPYSSDLSSILLFLFSSLSLLRSYDKGGKGRGRGSGGEGEGYCRFFFFSFHSACYLCFSCLSEMTSFFFFSFCFFLLCVWCFEIVFSFHSVSPRV